MQVSRGVWSGIPVHTVHMTQFRFLVPLETVSAKVQHGLDRTLYAVPPAVAPDNDLAFTATCDVACEARHVLP